MNPNWGLAKRILTMGMLVCSWILNDPSLGLSALTPEDRVTISLRPSQYRVGSGIYKGGDSPESLTVSANLFGPNAPRAVRAELFIGGRSMGVVTLRPRTLGFEFSSVQLKGLCGPSLPVIVRVFYPEEWSTGAVRVRVTPGISAPTQNISVDCQPPRFRTIAMPPGECSDGGRHLNFRVEDDLVGVKEVTVVAARGSERHTWPSTPRLIEPKRRVYNDGFYPRDLRLSSGQWQLEFKATDYFDYHSPYTIRSIRIDSEYPTVRFASEPGARLPTPAHVRFRWEAEDARSGCGLARVELIAPFEGNPRLWTASAEQFNAGGSYTSPEIRTPGRLKIELRACDKADLCGSASRLIEIYEPPAKAPAPRPEPEPVPGLK